MTNRKAHIVLLGGDGGRSGVPRHIEQICKTLLDIEENRYRLTVVSETNAGGFDFTNDIDVTHKSIPALASSRNPIRVLKGLRGLNRVLRDDPAELVWAHARMTVLMVRLLPRRATKLVITFHGSPFLGRAPNVVRIVRMIEAMCLRLTKPLEIVFLSERDKRSFEQLPLRRHRCHVIQNVAADLESSCVDPLPFPTLVMTTRDSPQKNLIAAAGIFKHMPPKSRLFLLGSGTDTADLKARFATILSPDALSRVEFKGQISDVSPYLKQAHGYLMTSRYEGMSIGALEAFSTGLPVFMPNIGGADEIVRKHPQAAIIDPLLPKSAVEILLPILETYRKNPQKHASETTAAYRAQFSTQRWEKSVISLLEGTITGKST